MWIVDVDNQNAFKQKVMLFHAISLRVRHFSAFIVIIFIILVVVSL